MFSRLTGLLRRAQQPALAFSVAVLGLASSVASASEQTTQQLPLPTGQTQTQSDDKRWQVTFDSAWNYSGTRETSPTVPGWKNSVLSYLPVGLLITTIPNDELKFEVGVRTGYMDLHVTNSGGTNLRYTGWTDTSVVGTLTYYGLTGIQPFISLAANLPTGQSNVSSLLAANAPDPDVTQIAGFGTGLNVGPTIGTNIAITKDMLATVSAGYTTRGNFERSGLNLAFPTGRPGEGLTEQFKPGDVTTVNMSLGYQSGPWSAQALASYSYEGVTRVDGIGFYQTGGKYSLAAALGYAWTQAWSSRITGTFAHIDKNRYPNDVFKGTDFVQEFFNTNSNMMNVVLDTTYTNGNFAIGPTGSYLHRDHNGYDSNTGLFLPAKNKWTAGAAGQIAVTNAFSLNARAEHLWMTEDEKPGGAIPPPSVPELVTKGWLATIGGKATF